MPNEGLHLTDFPLYVNSTQVRKEMSHPVESRCIFLRAVKIPPKIAFNEIPPIAGVVDDAAEEDPAVERRQLVGQRARRPRRLPQGEVPRLRMRTHHIALRRTGMDNQWNFSKA